MPRLDGWTPTVFTSFIVLAISSQAAHPADGADASVGRPPNIVLLLADDMGWTAPACYGSDTHLTPNIDRLATEGMKFTDAYAACAVCSPTRASVMTGKYPARLHLTDWIASTKDVFWDYAKLREPDWTQGLGYDQATVAELLRSSGYKTAHIGKWHLEKRAVEDPLKHGFDVTVGSDLKGGFFLTPKMNPGIVKKNQYRTDFLTDHALEMMRKWREQPFFIYLAFYNPHRPIEGKPELVKYYSERTKSGAVHANPEYAAMIHSFDQNVGRIMSELDRLGLTDNTLLVFTSDNGGLTHDYDKYIAVTDNRPLRRGKGACYEGGVREPWIVRWPGVAPSGAVCHEPVCTIDLLPTFVRAAGITPPIDIDGCDLTPLLQHPDVFLDRDALYWHYPHYHPGQASGPFSAIRAGNWKLIHFYEDDSIELYNLADDIGETHDRAETHPERAAALLKQLAAWRSSVDAQPPLPNPDYDPDKADRFEWRSLQSAQQCPRK